MVIKIFRNVSTDDWQYVVPCFICFIGFIATDLLNLFEKINLSYWSGGLFLQPYRIVTSHFVHADIKHLLANIFGVIVARHCLRGLRLKSKSFFVVVVGLLIPIQVLILWTLDIFLLRDPMSLAVGFSGVLYGIDAFILLGSIYGKKTFIGLEIDLKKNDQVRQIMLVLTIIGIVWSFLPDISFLGHFAGLLAGSCLFFL